MANPSRTEWRIVNSEANRKEVLMQRILTRAVSESTSRSGFNREVCTGNGTTLSVVEFVVKDIDSRPEFYKESLFPQCYPTVAALTGKNGFRGSGRKNHAVLIDGNSVKIKFRNLQCYPYLKSLWRWETDKLRRRNRKSVKRLGNIVKTVDIISGGWFQGGFSVWGFQGVSGS